MLRNNIMPRLADANISSLGYLWCTMGHNPKGHLMKFTQHTIPCRFGFELKTHVAWHICNSNLSCPTKRFHGTKRICQVTFNIYIVGVVSMHSPLSLHSWSIPTVNRWNAQATSTSSLRCVSTFQSSCVHGGLHKVLLLKTRWLFVGKILLK